MSATLRRSASALGVEDNTKLGGLGDAVAGGRLHMMAAPGNVA